MKKLIIRVFYINIGGLTRQQTEQQLFAFMSENQNTLPDDIKEHYHLEDVWLPVTGDQPTKVEIIYPQKFEMDDLDLDNIDKLIEKLNEIKLKLNEA